MNQPASPDLGTAEDALPQATPGTIPNADELPVSAGVDTSAEKAPAQDSAIVAAALTRLAELTLGATVELTREEVAEAAGVTVDQARPYWRAMGFADVRHEKAFTQADVRALRMLLALVADETLDEVRAIELVRSLGQSASRLTDWQVGLMSRILAESEEPVDLENVLETAARILPQLESLLIHAWRRHLAAVIGRPFTPIVETDVEDLGQLTVGFADIAGFTRLSRVLSDVQLAALVKAFESGAADVVAGQGARLVKTLGDEVMFVADNPDIAVSIAANLHKLSGPEDVELRLRIGLATGRVVNVMGDYYGETANRASRLTAVSRPGQTLVDGATEEGLADEYLVRHHRPRALRGLGLMRTTSVQLRDSP